MMAIIAGILFCKPASSQVSVNINIGAQPSWGPVGYDYVEYYYLPDIEVYYYVPRHQYVYLSNGRWIFSTSLPYRYRSYNLYSGYKVVINEPKPYLYFSNHKVKYAKYKGYNNKQTVIRNSSDAKYKSRGNIKSNGNIGKGKGNGNGNGNRKGKH